MIDKIIKDLENNLKIKIDKDKIVYYTDGATDSIVFNIDNKYLIKTVDELTYSSQTEFLNFYKDIPQFQNIIHTNKNLQYICFEFKKGNLYRKNRISPEKTIEQVFNIVKQYREYNHPYFGYLYEDEKSWYEFLKDEVEYSNNKMRSANIDLTKVESSLNELKNYIPKKYLIHGDFGVHNFIVDKEEVNVIDPMPVVGDYLYDFYFSIYSDTEIFSNIDISKILNYFDIDKHIKQATLTIVLFIRMSRAFVYDNDKFYIYEKYYNEVI